MKINETYDPTPDGDKELTKADTFLDILKNFIKEPSKAERINSLRYGINGVAANSLGKNPDDKIDKKMFVNHKIVDLNDQ